MQTTIPLAQILKVKPDTVIGYLQVEIGAKVVPGDIIAVKKGLLGKSQEVKAEVEGELESLSQESGELLIKTSPKQKSQTAEGKLEVLDECLDFGLLTPKHKDKILAVPRIESEASIYKADALELNGLIIGWSPNPEKIHQAAQKADLPVLILSHHEDEGKKKFSELAKKNGQNITIDQDEIKS